VIRSSWLFWLVAGISGLSSSAAPDLKTRLVFKEHADFMRLTEFFGRKENPSGRAIVRSQPRSRAGLYFSLNIARGVGELPKGAKVVLEFVHPKLPEVRSYELIAPRTPIESHEMLVGLTGEDWIGPAQKPPVAWRVQILDASGDVLASEQSFLWALPKPVSASSE